MKKSSLIQMTCGILLGITGFAVGVVLTSKDSRKELERVTNMSNKHLQIMRLFNQWMITKQNGKSLTDYFNKRNMHVISIYGMGALGCRLFDELKDTNIDISYVIDQNKDNVFIDADMDVDIFSPEEPLRNVDAIVVTSISFFEEIEDKLKAKTACPILSLEDIIYEL